MKTQNGKGQIITFYSFKGGTGRTMALANIACLLAKVEKVKRGILIIDWDLEAPGLHYFFRNRLVSDKEDALSSDEVDKHIGLIELFEYFNNEFRNLKSTTKKDDYFESFDISKYVINTKIPHLHLLKAGKFDNDYANKVSKFRWDELYNNNPRLISAFVAFLRNRYDYILIDSRTGVTDTSGICTMLMPEKLVVVFTPNRQNLFGTLDQVVHSVNYRRQSNDTRPLMVYPLPSRIESTEPDLRKAWRFGGNDESFAGYQNLFEKTLAEIYGIENCDLDTYFNEIQIQHVPKYSYGEEIAVLVERVGDKFSLATSFETIAERLISSRCPWDRIVDPFDEIFVQAKDDDASLVEIGLHIEKYVQENKVENNNYKQFLDAFWRFANLAENRLDYSLAETWYHKALDIAEKYTERKEMGKILNKIAMINHQNGNVQSAETALKSALGIYRELEILSPGELAPDISMILNNLSNILSATGDTAGALSAIEEAVEIRRRLATASPARFEPDLASSLNNLSNRLSDTGDTAGALEAIKEASELYRKLAKASPARFEPDLAMSLNNLSNHLSATGDTAGALEAIKEASELYRKLAKASPARFEPDLAMSCGAYGRILLTLGKIEEAAALFKEGADMIRPYAEKWPGSRNDKFYNTLMDDYKRAMEMMEEEGGEKDS